MHGLLIDAFKASDLTGLRSQVRGLLIGQIGGTSAVHALLLLACALFLCRYARAFDLPSDTHGGLTVTISDPGEVTALGRPVSVPVTLSNRSSVALNGNLRVWVADHWIVDGKARLENLPFSLAAGVSRTFPISVAANKGTYAALYPVNVQAVASNGSSAHAVLILNVSPLAIPRPATPKELPTLANGTNAVLGTTEMVAMTFSDQNVNDLEFRFTSGPHGLVDGTFEISNSPRSGRMLAAPAPPLLILHGFVVEVDGHPIGPGGWRIENLEATRTNGKLIINHWIAVDKQKIDVQAQIWTERGALRVAFSMPGVRRNARGSPRFTNLGIGPSSENAKRVYAGFGNVLENPGPLELHAGGSELSTRHVGADYVSGVSLVQATDVFPDLMAVNPENKRCTLFAHNDVTFAFIPSRHGAFAAARLYRDIVNFRAADGVATLEGKMCLDQWGGNYQKTAQDIEIAAAYGLTNAVFVKHVWQRWGYDYRLPDIYPPAGDWDEFRTMVTACKKAGILFVPHDNYIDFYPDARDFSYDKIVFNADGTPQKAWFNEGRMAQSYRWLPTAFAPFLHRNLKLMKAGFSPDGLFVDVFGAIAPFDFYDRGGKFYPKTITQREWSQAFDDVRRVFGPLAPTISEEGVDALIGHLAAGQSDHVGWVSPDVPLNGNGNDFFNWRLRADDGERVPWHDIATHGSFVLFAGGLGVRYAGGQDEFLHGDGSDDYLSLTVLGGRNPMCDGPFSRRAVMTYWLLDDISRKLAHSAMLSHQFVGDNIHRQRVELEDASVQVNRGKDDWQTDGLTLPQYGFIAKAGNVRASIVRRNGQVVGFSSTPEVLFADARPPSREATAIRPRVLDVTNEGHKIRLRVAWDVLHPLGTDFRPFLHFSNPSSEGSEHIAFQGGGAFDGQRLTQRGTFETTLDAMLPNNLPSNDEFAVRLGLWNPLNGQRAPLAGPQQNGRALAGSILTHIKAGQLIVTYKPDSPNLEALQREARLNMEGKMINFGPVVTNGAFRLKHTSDDWILTPLPDSSPFDVALSVEDLGARRRNFTGITAIDIAGKPLNTVQAQWRGDLLLFHTSGAFAYKIHFAP